MGVAHANDDEHGDYCHGTNVIVGSRQNDVIPGTRCDDTIWGLKGNDRISGNGGEDTLLGNGGNDRLNGVDVFGSPEPDVLRGGRGFDACVGDPFDTFLGCESVEILF
jgi:Ca2+-binding RTX toxin-like protein